jgi:2-succinyl-5-enolpyruvyl-6-hydroxy-3-cyclohexene-1-carboxylate synthase
VVYETIIKKIPAGSYIHAGNSTPVRYLQLFQSKQGVRYVSNRGTSGIDGSLSTAAGAAMADSGLHVAIVGDLSFIYDSNAFWNNHLPANLRVIVVDNDGGNIFRLIETSPLIDPVMHYFETPHRVNIAKLCEAFGLKYFHADSAENLKPKIDEFFKPIEFAGVLHIKTSGITSSQVYKQYFQSISQRK